MSRRENADLVVYRRVSTKEQGRSGLGLEAKAYQRIISRRAVGSSASTPRLRLAKSTHGPSSREQNDRQAKEGDPGNC